MLEIAVVIVLNSIIAEVFLWLTEFLKLRYKTEE